MKYTVYYRKINNGRAEAMVNLEDDYQRFMVLEVDGRRHVERRLQAMTDVTSRIAGTSRKILVGDVLVEEDGSAYIYTPTGAWASVVTTKA